MEATYTYISENANWNSDAILSLKRHCCAYSEVQYVYNPFRFPGIKSPTGTFHLKISLPCLALPCLCLRLCLVLSSIFLLTNSPSNEDTSEVNKEKELMHLFVYHHWSQSSAYSVPFLALCLLSMQWAKPVREGTAFVQNKALWRLYFSELLRLTVISIIANSLMWQQFSKDKKKNKWHLGHIPSFWENTEGQKKEKK